jgi:F-box/leucine-rich repeat protein 2/20
MMGLALTSNTFLGGVCGRARTLNFVRSFGYDVPDNFRASQVTTLLRRCDGLRHVTLFGDVPIDQTEFVVALMAYSTSLRSLTLKDGSLTDSAVAAMVRVHTGLVKLNLRSQEKLTDVALLAMARHLPKLELLRMACAPLISDVGVVALAQNCAGLETLDLGDTTITDAALVALANDCHKLQNLDVNYCSNISDTGVIALAQKCSALKTLDLGGTRVTDAGVSAVANNCTNIEDLNLSHVANGITDVALRVIAQHLPKLRLLHLGLCSGISDSGVIELARNCHALKELDLSNTLVTDASVSAIASNCPMLENLNLADDDLRSLPTEGRVPSLITDKSVIALARNCPRLRVLKLSGTAVTDVGMEALGIGCSLENLTLDCCEHVSDDGVAALLPGLSTKSWLTLRLDKTRITDVSVLAIAARFPKLFTLDVNAADCDVGDYEIRALARCCPGLRRLHVRDLGLISQGTHGALSISHPNLSIY